MCIAGLDLAALPSNPTGFTAFIDNRLEEVELVKTDEEILEKIEYRPFSVISIDAPLNVSSNTERECDRIMKKYGAMPLKLKGMKMLADRGEVIVDKIEKNLESRNQNFKLKFIEVFPTGTAKILEFHSKDIKEYRKNLMHILDVFKIKDIDIVEQIGTKHELDSIITGFTGWLFRNRLTTSVGEHGAEIIIPDILKIYQHYDESLIKKAVLSK